MTIDNSIIAALEHRATLAEERIHELEVNLAKRLNLGFGLDELEDLKGRLATAEQERDALMASKVEAENVKNRLEEENSKLKYQILHLKRAVAEGDIKLREAKNS